MLPPNPLNRDEELYDQVAALLRREFNYMTSNNTLSALDTKEIPSTSATPTLPKLHAQWRPSIFEWFYKIVDHFLLERGVVAIAMDYVDRFLLVHPSTHTMDIKMYQLIAMSSLYVAMKLHGGNDAGGEVSPWRIRRKTFCLKGFVKLSRGQFVPQDVVTMETLILKTLNWKMNPVTTSCFLDSFMDMFPKPSFLFDNNTNAQSKKYLCMGFHVLHELARYLAELAICIPGITPYFGTEHSGRYSNQLAPSAVSYAAILLAMDMMTLTAVPMVARLVFQDRCSSTQHRIVDEQSESEYMPFLQNRPEILKLKKLIHRSFVPSLVLGPLPTQEKSGSHYQPFKIARTAGMFNMHYFKDDAEAQEPPIPNVASR